MTENQRLRAALSSIAGDGDATGRNPQLMADIAVAALTPPVPAPSPKMIGLDAAFVDAAYDLSTWAARIHWHGELNEKGWLDELREKIELVQKMITEVHTAEANQQTTNKIIDEDPVNNWWLERDAFEGWK